MRATNAFVTGHEFIERMFMGSFGRNIVVRQNLQNGERYTEIID